MKPAPTTIRTASGTARVLGPGAELPHAELLEWCAELGERRSGCRREFGETRAILKGGPLSRSGARRHGLRRASLGAPAPCAAEFLNLTWLRRRLFRAAEPLGAVTVTRLGVPRHELLVTREVRSALPFDRAVAAAAADRRRALFEELGREVGRMHALRFLHADLYPRNVLVTAPESGVDPGHGRSLVWIDVWAGGPTAWRRGNLRRLEDDLGAWFGEAADWMTPADSEGLLTAYVRSRAANGRPVPDLSRLVGRIQRARRRELARFEREPRRLRGRPFPVAGWDPDVGRLARRTLRTPTA